MSEPRKSFRFSHRQSVGLVFLCTLFGVAAQYFIKSSGMQMAQITLAALLANWQLWTGLSLYGVSTGLLILALRDGELSLLYPVISLTYVWVTILSVLVFQEKVTIFKTAGVATICCGVALLGKGKSE
ncbi:MAG: permease [Bryobacteraceae bacterium]|nr:MAG: permease [Bryobacteraceae bacterium]